MFIKNILIMLKIQQQEMGDHFILTFLCHCLIATKNKINFTYSKMSKVLF